MCDEFIFPSHPRLEISAQNQIANIAALIDCIKPVIVAASGLVLGSGLTCTILCDRAFISENTQLSFFIAHWRAAPQGCACAHLPRIVGIKAAVEMLMRRRVLDSEAAEQVGLVHGACKRQNSQVRRSNELRHLDTSSELRHLDTSANQLHRIGHPLASREHDSAGTWLPS